MTHHNLDPASRPMPPGTLIAADFAPESVVEADPEAPAGPKVVIHYRRTGLPWPLALLLIAVTSLAAVAGYHRLTRHAVAPATARPPAAPEVAVNPAPEAPPTNDPPRPAPPPEPLTLSSQRGVATSLPPGPVAPDALVGPPSVKAVDPALTATATATATSPPPVQAAVLPIPPLPVLPTTLELATRFATPAPPQPGTGLGTEPKAPVAVKSPDPDPAPTPHVTPPQPEPLPSKEEVLANIQREAVQKQADRQELKQFKAELPEISRRAYIETVNAQRPQFLTELRDLLRGNKAQAGEQIEKLHLRYHEEVDQKTEGELRRLMKRFSGRTSLQAKVKSFRSLGLPEPVILDIVCKEVHRREHSSRCRCFSPAMYVMAARELLAADSPSRAKPSPDHRSTASNRAPTPAAGPARPTSTGNRASVRTQ